MALTRSFKETVVQRGQNDAAFAHALVVLKHVRLRSERAAMGYVRSLERDWSDESEFRTKQHRTKARLRFYFYGRRELGGLPGLLLTVSLKSTSERLRETRVM